MKRILAILMMASMSVALLAGCGGEEETHTISKTSDASTEEAEVSVEESASEEEVSVYYFLYADTKLYPNMSMAKALEAIGEGSSYYEAASCAFEGEMDKTYGYGSFQIVTYPTDGEDWISYIQLLDDTVSTAEGVKIGASFDDVVAAYGDDYKEQGSMLVYEIDDMELCFLISDDEVTSIQYLTTLIDL